LVLRYRISDPVVWYGAAQDVAANLSTEAQLVYRRQVAGHSLDELLESRSTLSAVLCEEMASRARDWGVEILAFDIKDLILPGEMKTLFARVIEAEKQAQAQGILRREEAASTRSLANTARLYENNPTMLRLKELEQMKEIAANAEHVTLVTDPILSFAFRAARAEDPPSTTP